MSAPPYPRRTTVSPFPVADCGGLHDGIVFPAAEFAARLAAVQQRMAAAGYATLIVSDPANLYYLTGYNAWSFYTPQGLIVPADGLPHLFARAMDAGGAHYTAVLPRENLHGYPEHLVQRPDVHPWEWIAARAREIGLLPPGELAGIELDGYFFSPRGYLALTATVPEIRLDDCHDLVNWVRLVKTPAEQTIMREAGRITRAVMERATQAVRAGRRQCDVVAEIQHTQARGVAGLGGDYPAIVPMLPTGQTAGTPHLTWSPAPLVAGEATTIELAGVRERYHVPLARTVSLGAPPRQLADCASAIADGLAAALAAIRPGADCAAPHAAFTAELHRHGFRKDSRIGYPIGIGYPPDWGERTASLRAEDGTPLAAGMCFHLILGMWMDGWGYETSESVLVTDDGCELLAELPQGLVINDDSH